MARGCSTRARSSFSTPPASRRRWPSSGSAPARRMPPPSWTRRSADRRRQDLQAAPAGQYPCQGLLVARALRQPDTLDAADRPAVPEHRQPEEGHRDQPRQLGGRLLRSQAAVGQGEQLGPDLAGQGLERHSSPLRPAAAVFDKTWRPGEIEEVR